MTEVIYEYTREQAIADGVLIDVTATAKEAGIVYPVAVTSAVWAKCATVSIGLPDQDESGRLWDVLRRLRHGISQARDASEVRFTLYVKHDDRPPSPVVLKAVCGPGDDLEPVITVMMPDED